MNSVIDNVLRTAAKALGLQEGELDRLAEFGESQEFPGGTWLFEEGTGRRWMGVIEEGEVQIKTGRYGDRREIVTLGPGAMIGEAVMFSPDTMHSTGAKTRNGAKVFVLPKEALAKLREQDPDLYFMWVARLAQRLSDRLQRATQQLAEGQVSGAPIATTRMEHDSLGDREVPSDAYYGVQTVRAIENFPISGIKLWQFGTLVSGLAFVKKAAAIANAELGVLDPAKKDAIVAACDEIIAFGLRRNFVVDMVQGGAGTSTNMNANEVIANRGLELMGKQKGEYEFLHPNDDVNCSQSTNDAYPTAVKLGIIFTVQETLAALENLEKELDAKAVEFADVIKMGRTENQDAVPMTLGQEFGAYAGMMRGAKAALLHATDELHKINMGATAIGTGLNSPPGYADLVTRHLAEITGVPVHLADDLVEATQDAGAFAQCSGAMKRAAIQISKICNDLRWLSSGPRAGLNEINLPPRQPGSSIMPGKVNPVIPECVNQVCYQIIGFDTTISMAAEATELELNMAEPIMAFDLLSGLTMLANACVMLANQCISGITANREVTTGYVERSIGLVTALNPVLGYERSVSVAKEALATGRGVKELVLERGWISPEELEKMLDPAVMANPVGLS
ncbi:MAG: aspartate ammonia-lyase [Candidatus Nanopelagicales bacterium]